MTFKPGDPKNKLGGRPKGRRNKINKNLVENILEISADLDRRKVGLRDCAHQDPKWFYQNFVRALIPKNVDVNLEGELVIKWQGS